MLGNMVKWMFKTEEKKRYRIFATMYRNGNAYKVHLNEQLEPCAITEAVEVSRENGNLFGSILKRDGWIIDYELEEVQ